MRNGYRALARKLEGSLDERLRRGLARDPRLSIQGLGIVVEPMPITGITEDCSCDGAFFSRPRPVIGYLPTPESRRENFTLLHELGHFLARSNDDVLSELADMGEDGGKEAEERVCDAFAGAILIPKTTVDAVLGGRRPEARHIPQLFAESNGSREACAVRLSERMNCFGYVALLDPGPREVRFASASPSCPYIWRRGTPLPASHPAWRATGKSHFRGEGEVVWSGGGRKNLWLDAVFDRSVVCAIFAEERYWAGEGLGLLSGASGGPARTIALSGTCKHCGASTWGYKPCEKCGDVRCRSCGKCGCGAKVVADRVCPRCFLVKATTQYRPGSEVCRDCE